MEGPGDDSLFEALFFPEDMFGGDDAVLTPSALLQSKEMAPVGSWPTEAVENPVYQKKGPQYKSGSSGSAVPDKKRPRTSLEVGAQSENSSSEGCSGVQQGYKSAGSYSTDEGPMGNDVDRSGSNPNSTTSEDEKLEHRKERNRRHARETRRRKKEYVEELKSELDSLRTEKAVLETRMRDTQTMRAELHEAWLQALEKVLALWASAESDSHPWLELLDDEAVMVHPITPYRSYRQADVIENRIVLMGVSDIMADAASLQVALCALGAKGVHGSAPAAASRGSARVQLRFNISREEMHFGSDGLMCPFEMTTLNLTSFGLRCEVAKRGCLRATFRGSRFRDTGNQKSINDPLMASMSSAGYDVPPKLMQLEMYYDPISVWRQMQSARGIHPTAEPVDGTSADGATGDIRLNAASKVAGKGDLKVPSQPPPPPAVLSIVPPDRHTAVFPSSKPVITPNTLQQAMKPSHEARVITEATRPFRITYVNEAWTQLCGFSPEEACGRTLRMLQGEDTDISTVNDLVKDCVEQKATSMEVNNYDKQGRKFRNFLQVYPLSDTCNSAGETSHLLGVLTPLSGACH